MPVKFSIITVCKNPGDSFLITLESVRRQAYKDFEWIIIDAQSTDGTTQAIHRHKSIVSYYISEPDNGIYDAMNKGVKCANGEYVYFLNCGDTFHDDDVLKKVSEYITANGDLIYGDSWVTDPKKQKVFIKSHSKVDKYYLFNMPINHQALFARKSLFETVGFFDTTFVLRADHDWMVRCLTNNVKFSYVPIIIANYVRDGFSAHNRSKYSAKERKRIQKGYFKIVGRFAVRCIKRIDVEPNDFFRGMLNNLL